MRTQATPDTGARTALELNKIHSTYERVDEAYRRFRSLLMKDPPGPGIMPIEWLPISDY
jgi:hypothetical protein